MDNEGLESRAVYIHWLDACHSCQGVARGSNIHWLRAARLLYAAFHRALTLIPNLFQSLDVGWIS